MSNVSKVDLHEWVCQEIHELYIRKNHDYGDSFGKTFEDGGFAMSRIRLSDKLNRFKTLSRESNRQAVTDESIRDTLIDLANYAIMTIIEMDMSNGGVYHLTEKDKTIRELKEKMKQVDRDIAAMSVGAICEGRCSK